MSTTRRTKQAPTNNSALGPVGQPIIWRTQYDYDRDAAEREASNQYNDEPSMTQQQHAEDADLNVIMKRFGITDGALPPQALDPQYFGEFDSELDLSEAFRRQREASDRFEQLPATIRNRFHNNPAELYRWINDPANLDEAYEMKMLVRPDDWVEKKKEEKTVPPEPAPK